MSKLVTNKIVFSPNFTLIDLDFDFYKISTSEKYISGGAEFLDELASGIILSICYDGGKSFFSMTKKNATTNSEVIKILRNCEKGETLSLEKIAATQIPENVLLQLFMNSIGSNDSEYFSFNNLTGKLFCYNPEWKSVEKKTGFVWSLQCVEARVSKNMELRLLAHKMNSIRLKNQMKFEKRKFREFPQYCIAFANSTLRRVSKSEHSTDGNFILKAVNDKRAFIPFFDFSDWKKFSATKLGVLFQIQKILHKKYSRYFSFGFEEFEITKSLKLKRTELESYKNVVQEIAKENGINFCDCVKSSTSNEFLHDVADIISGIVGNLKISFNRNPEKTSLNIRYIREKNSYEENDDPHQDDFSGFAVQHITNNFPLNSSGAKVAAFNILKELVIKNDIRIGKISLIDWSEFGFSGDTIFGIQHEQKFYFMTIHKDGKFMFQKIETNFFAETEFDCFMEIFENSGDEKIIGVVKDCNGNINMIKETELFSLPDFDSVGKILEDVAANEKISGETLIHSLEEIPQDESIAKAIENILPEKFYSKAEILNLFDGRSSRQKVVEKIFADTGIRLRSYLRNAECREEYFSGMTDISLVSLSENAAYCCVGEIGSGMKNAIERSCTIRKIEASNSSGLFFEKLLPTMGVEFVRCGMLTVLPFPFKYLREWAQAEKR